jgi:hypothetical protein
MNDERKDLHPDRTPTGHLDEAPPESRRPTGDRAAAGSARAAGLEPGSSTTGSQPRKNSAESNREISGELDRAVNAPDHDESRDRASGARQEEAPLPIRGR